MAEGAVLEIFNNMGLAFIIAAVATIGTKPSSADGKTSNLGLAENPITDGNFNALRAISRCGLLLRPYRPPLKQSHHIPQKQPHKKITPAYSPILHSPPPPHHTQSKPNRHQTPAQPTLAPLTVDPNETATKHSPNPPSAP